jgi:hypothetical protein
MKTVNFLSNYRDYLRRQLKHNPQRAEWAIEQLRELLQGPADKNGKRLPLPESIRQR